MCLLLQPMPHNSMNLYFIFENLILLVYSFLYPHFKFELLCFIFILLKVRILVKDALLI